MYKESEKILFFDFVEDIKDTLKSEGEGCLIPILERFKKLVNKAYIRKSAKEESSSVCISMYFESDIYIITFRLQLKYIEESRQERDHYLLLSLLLVNQQSPLMFHLVKMDSRS